MTDTLPSTAPLPRGVVTFLLTDIEGSTRAWEADGEVMAAAVARHYAILDAAIAAHGGVRPVEQGEGDSLVAAFERAAGAVAAALDAQRALSAEPWPGGVVPTVRIAVHTGEARIRDDRYYAGPSIIRCARLRTLGHGGQVLVSGATADLLAGEMPDGAHLLPLGVHRLRDLTEPVRVFQLAHEQLPADFPALRSLDALPNNLPAALSGFVGRTSELSELAKLLDEHRLVSLVGPGGGGKTRLATQVAAALLDRHPDGTWWAELAPVSDPAQVAHTVMTAIGIGDDRGLGPIERVVSFLGEQQVLVVLDNCEHLLGAAAEVADALLSGCPNVRVAVTSREPLGLAGERVWRMVPLSHPTAADSALSAEAALEYESVALFVERAREVRPAFVLDADTAGVVAAICARLDGLPLAIELAAARTRGMSPHRILAGLDDRFRLLTGGSRTAVGRQQTLAASVEWSHQLLSDAERLVFRRLAACAGGFTLEAAEAIAGGPDLDAWEVLDLLTALVDKSLVTFDGERYGMLATLRDFAASQLLASEDTAVVRDRHAAHFLARAEAASELIENQIRHGLMDDLRADHDNLRVALEWSVGRPGDTVTRLVAALMFFWLDTGHFTEGLAWHRRVLADLPEETTPTRCRVMWGLGHLSLNCAEMDNSLGMGDLADALAMARELDDPKMIARPLAAQGAVFVLATGEDPMPALTEATDLARTIGDEWLITYARWWEATYLAVVKCDSAAATAALVELDDLGRRAASANCLGWNDWVRGADAWVHGRLEEAWTEFDRGLQKSYECDEPLMDCMTVGLGGLWALTELGRYDQAEAVGLASLARLRRNLDICRQGVVEMATARIAVARGEVRAAERELAGIDEMVRGAGLPFLVEFLQLCHGRVALATGDAAAAREYFDDAAIWCAEQNWHFRIAEIELHHALVDLAQHDPGAAETRLHRALALQVQFGFRSRATDVLETLARTAAVGESFAESARLLGAAAALRQQTGAVRWAFDAPAFEQTLTVVRAGLGEDAMAEAWAAGAALSLEQVGAYAARARGERKRPSSGWDSLTPTELEVVAATITGATNAVIGERLFISPATVKTHLQNIYAKLGVANRAVLTAEATARGVSPRGDA